MSKLLLPLCTIPPIAIRDGYTGANARIYLPFYTPGYWFASGQQLSWPQASAMPQDRSRTMGGTKMLDNFQKDCCTCSGA